MIDGIIRVLWVLLLTGSAIAMAWRGDAFVPVLVVCLLVSELVSIKQERIIKMYQDALGLAEKMVKDAGGTA